MTAPEKLTQIIRDILIKKINISPTTESVKLSWER